METKICIISNKDHINLTDDEFLKEALKHGYIFTSLEKFIEGFNAGCLIHPGLDFIREIKIAEKEI